MEKKEIVRRLQNAEVQNAVNQSLILCLLREMASSDITKDLVNRALETAALGAMIFADDAPDEAGAVKATLSLKAIDEIRDAVIPRKGDQDLTK